MSKIRRYIPVLLIVLLMFTLSSCGVPELTDEKADIPTCFESDFKANVGKLAIEGHISKPCTGACTITISNPATLSGLQIEYKGDTVKASVSDSHFDGNMSSFPANNFIKSVSDSIDYLNNADGINTVLLDSVYKYSSTSNYGNFFVLQDRKTLLLTSLTIESGSIWLDFLNFEPLQE